MLRSSVLQGRQILSSSARPRIAPQWLPRAGAASRLAGQRSFVDAKPPTPVTPSSTSPAPVESPTKQTGAEIPTPPAPVPARKSGRFRRFLIYLILTSGLAYGGGVFLALKSDNFHDFFTEYIPYGEESVLYFEERDFYRRFPNTLRSQNRLTTAPRDEGSRVTIPSKSGLHSKEVQKSEADLSQPGPHMSAVPATKVDEAAVKPAAAKPEEKTAKVEEAKKQAQQESEKPAREPKLPASPLITTLEFAKVSEGDEPIVQELVKTFNDIITVISADENSGKYSKPVEKAKEELQKVGEQILAVRDEARRAAQEEIEKAHATFDESARELLRRFDEVRTNDASQFREEFEAEREKLALAYQQKMQTEMQRAQEIAEQRLQNELVEQAIELNRKYLHEVKDLVERERDGRLSKLSELTDSVSDLEKLTTGWREVIDTNLKTQQLQVAVDAVRSALERSTVPRPFVRELVAVKELAGDDPVVEAAIASINPTAYQRGIPSTAQIIERFRRVADEVRKASLLPEDAGIASHAASLVLSKVMFKKDAEAGSDDVESVLLRTENLLEEGNLDAAAREMNSLKGWAKILSKDWLGDVRRVLEVKQALEVIETEARLQCLRVE
ncbi:MICOS complex subunit mic60 [Aspergillus crustosus]